MSDFSKSVTVTNYFSKVTLLISDHGDWSVDDWWRKIFPQTRCATNICLIVNAQTTFSEILGAFSIPNQQYTHTHTQTNTHVIHILDIIYRYKTRVICAWAYVVPTRPWFRETGSRKRATSRTVGPIDRRDSRSCRDVSSFVISNNTRLSRQN